MITGNIIGAILKNPETIILRTDDGNEYAAAMTQEEVVLTADRNDVRLGETFASTKGVETGEKYIPSYHTTEGLIVVPNGSAYKLVNLSDYDLYDFTKFQAMICDLNTTIPDSTSVHTISLNEHVYEVKSTVSISTVTKDSIEKTIDLGLTNDTGNLQILRYFTYKET